MSVNVYDMVTERIKTGNHSLAETLARNPLRSI